MFFYFFSKTPAIIKIDGQYKGKISDGYKKFFIDISSPPFVEICFFCTKTSPLFFMLDNNFICYPPENVIITDLKGGYAINVNFEQATAPFSIINQQKFPFAVATVFNDNGLKLSIETPNDFYAKNLSFSCESAQILPFTLDNQQLLAINFLGEQNFLTCFLIQNQIKEVFSKKAVDFCFDNVFTTTETFLDIAKHKTICSWKLDGEKLVLSSTTIEKDLGFEPLNLPDSVLPYAFLEAFMLGDSTDDFLSDAVKGNAQFLEDYFGEFIGVFPPPSFRAFNEVALLYKQGQNTYKTEYFTFELNNKKICNIKRSDN